MPTPSFLRRHFGLVVLLVGAGTIAAAPLGIGSDGLVRFEALDALLRSGRLDPTKYSLLGPLAAAPLWYLGERLGRPAEAVWLFNRVAFLAGLAVLWRVLRPVLPPDERVRFAAALLFGSMFPWHVTGFYAEAAHVVAVGLGLALLATRRGWRAWAGAAVCVWGTANVPATGVGLAFAAGVLAWDRRRLRYLGLPVAAAVLILAENWVRRGDPLAGGYAGEAGHRTRLPYSGLPGFSYPLAFGLLSVLFSFGKGLVFFAPGLFAAYPPRDPAAEGEDRDAAARLVYRVWAAVVVGLVLVYARWWAWYGGAVWGPRFFLFAGLPAALVLARRTARPDAHAGGANALTLAAVALSCWVGASGLVFEGSGSERFWGADFETECLTWYVPECSVLWLPFVHPRALGGADRARLAAFAVGFAYLAGPVARAVAAQARVAVGEALRRARAGPRWRF